MSDHRWMLEWREDGEEFYSGPYTERRNAEQWYDELLSQGVTGLRIVRLIEEDRYGDQIRIRERRQAPVTGAIDE